MYKLFISILWFIAVFFFIYTYQYLFVIRKCRKNNYKIVPVEVQYIIVKFKIDVKMINLDKLVNVASLIAAFDIAFVYTVVTYFIENVYLSLIFIVILLIPTIIITYNLSVNWCMKRNKFAKTK